MAGMWNLIFGEASETAKVEDDQKVSFVINGEQYQICPNSDSCQVTGDSRLLDFIRSDAGLTGTKYMCREGGCGSCVVSATVRDVATGKEETKAVHSCLIPVLSCHGWIINTIESLGNKDVGYDEIQQKLVKFGGSQCGWCSPGMVMNMYSLNKSKKSLTAQEIEDSFDGNICRCTGYRPILEAFKSFAIDAPPELKAKCLDIEDVVGGLPCLKKHSSSPTPSAEHHQNDWVKVVTPTISSLQVTLTKSGEEWVKATSFSSIFVALSRFAARNLKCRIVAGNTGTGVFKDDGPYQAYIDITDVAELKKQGLSSDSSTYTVGAGLALANFIQCLKGLAAKPGFEYAEGMRKHIKRVANTPVRNVGTIGGNLMMKHQHRSFPSDVFLVLETVGAKLKIACSQNSAKSHNFEEFLNLDMANKIIVAIELPQRLGYIYRSFKISKRHQNAHAYVNAGFLFKLDDSFKVLEKPRILFGGINRFFLHATKTEEFLEGKELNKPEVLQEALAILQDEVEPDFVPPDASVEYRKALTQTLFYKFVLGILGHSAKAENRSGAEDLPRELTKSQQNFDSDDGKSPLYKPVAKLEAAAQVSGEAIYTNDIPPIAGELYGAFVISKVANARLGCVDASEALNLPGVVTFLQAKDIPGENNCMGYAARVEPEPIFATDRISFAGQAIGLIVAESPTIAAAAAKLVAVDYMDVHKPILTIESAIQKARDDGTYDDIFGTPIQSSEGPEHVDHWIEGEFKVSGQAHIQMETHVTLCRPTERGFDLFCATQGVDVTQATVSAALGVPANKINIQVRRLGGGYGSKLTRAAHTAVACALASQKTRKPVRVVLDFETNMKMVGKRFPIYAKYKVGFDDLGKIGDLSVQVICDTGAFQNEKTDIVTLRKVQSCYEAVGWELIPGSVRTNTPPNTWTRAPGSPKGVAIIETIMDHIAHTLKKDPMEIRKANLMKEGDQIMIPAPLRKLGGPNLVPDLFDQTEASAQVKKRQAEIHEFNKANRWRKRGIAVCPMRYPQDVRLKYGAYVAIYHVDGTVVVGHGGIEMGQGLNTKVAQVVAYALDIPLDLIEIVPTDSLIGANSSLTGGAMGSELTAYAALKASQELRARIDAVKTAKKLDSATWPELIEACYKDNVDLRATYFRTPKDGLQAYDIWGINCSEVEVDCLTGEFKITRSDMIQDAGKSLSPQVDIGQVEGAYVMGLGLWLKECLQYDDDTGELVTKNTWDYKVPFPKCIPEDFRVSLLSNRPNAFGVLSSKATGEAPICLSVTTLLALRKAIMSARADAGNTKWFNIDTPLTPEGIVKFCLTEASQFSL